MILLVENIQYQVQKVFKPIQLNIKINYNNKFNTIKMH